MSHHRFAAIAAVLFCATIALVAQRRASASVTLTTPVVTTVTAVACTSFQCNWGAGTDLGAAQCFIYYRAVDGGGNFLQSAPQQVAGPLAAADLNAFVTTPGNARVRCQAALMSNSAALAGDAQ